MAEFPALPIWTDAYLADTRHLSTLEHGAYLLLLMEAWRRPLCSLPDDETILARLAGLDVDNWASIRGRVMAFWKLDRRKKTWTQKRLVKQRDFTAKQSKSQRDKAVKRWNETRKSDAPAVPEACPVDTSISISNNTVPKGTGADPPPIDPVKALFDAGVALLTGTGITERSARGVIGKWRRTHGDEGTNAAILAASARKVTEPVSWIEGRLRAVSASEDECREISRATAQRYRDLDMPGPPSSAQPALVFDGKQ